MTEIAEAETTHSGVHDRDRDSARMTKARGGQDSADTGIESGSAGAVLLTAAGFTYKTVKNYYEDRNIKMMREFLPADEFAKLSIGTRSLPPHFQYYTGADSKTFDELLTLATANRDRGFVKGLPPNTQTSLEDELLKKDPDAGEQKPAVEAKGQNLEDEVNTDKQQASEDFHRHAEDQLQQDGQEKFGDDKSSVSNRLSSDSDIQSQEQVGKSFVEVNEEELDTDAKNLVVDQELSDGQTIMEKGAQDAVINTGQAKLQKGQTYWESGPHKVMEAQARNRIEDNDDLSSLQQDKSNVEQVGKQQAAENEENKLADDKLKQEDRHVEEQHQEVGQQVEREREPEQKEQLDNDENQFHVNSEEQLKHEDQQQVEEHQSQLENDSNLDSQIEDVESFDKEDPALVKQFEDNEVDRQEIREGEQAVDKESGEVVEFREGKKVADGVNEAENHPRRVEREADDKLASDSQLSEQESELKDLNKEDVLDKGEQKQDELVQHQEEIENHDIKHNHDEVEQLVDPNGPRPVADVIKVDPKIESDVVTGLKTQLDDLLSQAKNLDGEYATQVTELWSKGREEWSAIGNKHAYGMEREAQKKWDSEFEPIQAKYNSDLSALHQKYVSDSGSLENEINEVAANISAAGGKDAVIAEYSNQIAELQGKLADSQKAVEVEEDRAAYKAGEKIWGDPNTTDTWMAWEEAKASIAKTYSAKMEDVRATYQTQIDTVQSKIDLVQNGGGAQVGAKSRLDAPVLDPKNQTTKSMSSDPFYTSAFNQRAERIASERKIDAIKERDAENFKLTADGQVKDEAQAKVEDVNKSDLENKIENDPQIQVQLQDVQGKEADFSKQQFAGDGNQLVVNQEMRDGQQVIDRESAAVVENKQKFALKKSETENMALTDAKDKLMTSEMGSIINEDLDNPSLMQVQLQQLQGKDVSKQSVEARLGQKEEGAVEHQANVEDRRVERNHSEVKGEVVSQESEMQQVMHLGLNDLIRNQVSNHYAGQLDKLQNAYNANAARINGMREDALADLDTKYQFTRLGKTNRFVQGEIDKINTRYDSQLKSLGDKYNEAVANVNGEKEAFLTKIDDNSNIGSLANAKSASLPAGGGDIRMPSTIDGVNISGGGGFGKSLTSNSIGKFDNGGLSGADGAFKDGMKAMDDLVDL